MAETRRIDTLSVLFTDVVGSTELRSRLGDDDADRLFREHDVMLETAIGAHGGTLIKGLGDGFLATFGSAADAVAASVARLSAGDVDTYRAILEEAAVIAMRDGSPTQQWIIRSVLAADTVARGEFAEAQREIDELLALGERIGQPDAVQWWLASAFVLAWTKGVMEDVADSAGVAAEQLPALGIWNFGHAMALARAGRPVEARAVLAAHPPNRYPLDRDLFPFLGHWGCATAAWLLDDAEVGAHAAAGLEPHRGRWTHAYLGIYGPVQHPLGLAELACGRVDAGITDLEAALSHTEASGCVATAAVIALDLATALVRRGATGDMARARALLDAVRPAARASGATGIGDSAGRLAARLSVG